MICSMDKSASLTSINFHCRSCEKRFEGEPTRIEEAPERTWHPWAYFATCPVCECEAEQAPWEIGLLAAQGKQTGPRTPAGLAAVTANLAGHPTPEEARRTRFNAMKHGLFSRVATFYPAKPGQYPHCDGCEYFEGCGSQPACMKRTELFLRHQVAFETGDPGLLTDLRADLQAKIAAIIDDIILAIVRRGVEVETPQWYYDKDGGFHLAKYTNTEGEQILLTEVKQNPLLKILSEMISRNNLTLADMNMTPKVQDDRDTLRGHLDDEKENRESLLEFQRQQTGMLDQLSEQIARSRDRISRDPVLIEHQQASADG